MWIDSDASAIQNPKETPVVQEFQEIAESVTSESVTVESPLANSVVLSPSSSFQASACALSNPLSPSVGPTSPFFQSFNTQMNSIPYSLNPPFSLDPSQVPNCTSFAQPPINLPDQNTSYVQPQSNLSQSFPSQAGCSYSTEGVMSCDLNQALFTNQFNLYGGPQSQFQCDNQMGMGQMEMQQMGDLGPVSPLASDLNEICEMTMSGFSTQTAPTASSFACSNTFPEARPVFIGSTGITGITGITVTVAAAQSPPGQQLRVFG